MPDKLTEALSVFDQSNSLVRYAINETSFTMPDGAEFPMVERILKGFKIVGDATKFWRGDLLVYAQRNFGEMYSQLVDDSDYAFQTLKDEMWVSNNIAPSTRRGELSWSHHREVAALPKPDQVKWLAMAVEKSLSASSLRALIKDKKPKETDIIPKAAAFESALKAILKNSLDSEFFNEKFFHERLEDGANIDKPSLAITRAAIMAADVLKAYEKGK